MEISDVIKINTLVNKMLKEREQLIALHRAIKRQEVPIDDAFIYDKYRESVEKRIELLNHSLLGLFDKNISESIVEVQPKTPVHKKPKTELEVLQEIAEIMQIHFDWDKSNTIDYLSKDKCYLLEQIGESLQCFSHDTD